MILEVDEGIEGEFFDEDEFIDACGGVEVLDGLGVECRLGGGGGGRKAERKSCDEEDESGG